MRTNTFQFEVTLTMYNINENINVSMYKRFIMFTKKRKELNRSCIFAPLGP